MSDTCTHPSVTTHCTCVILHSSTVTRCEPCHAHLCGACGGWLNPLVALDSDGGGVCYCNRFGGEGHGHYPADGGCPAVFTPAALVCLRCGNGNGQCCCACYTHAWVGGECGCGAVMGGGDESCSHIAGLQGACADCGADAAQVTRDSDREWRAMGGHPLGGAFTKPK